MWTVFHTVRLMEQPERSLRLQPTRGQVLQSHIFSGQPIDHATIDEQKSCADDGGTYNFF